MAAQIIDGKAISEEIRASFKEEASALIARGITPCLAVMLVGEDPASKIYVRNKKRACRELGIRSLSITLPDTATEEEILAKVHELNDDPEVNGILVQLPLPKGLDEDKILAAIDPEKDVDGFSAVNMGHLAQGQYCLPACTPNGCLELIRRTGIQIAGAEAVVVGRSNIVGKPMAMLLTSANATVTVCHSRTRDLAAHTRNADIVVVATGHPNTVTGDMLKPGCVVIDVGINRTENGLVGDVDFASASEVAGFITPVPGGVGPMTITMLMRNTLAAARHQHGLE